MNPRRPPKQQAIAEGYKRLPQRDLETFIEIIERSTIHDLEQLRDALDREISLSLACIDDKEETDDRATP